MTHVYLRYRSLTCDMCDMNHSQRAINRYATCWSIHICGMTQVYRTGKGSVSPGDSERVWFFTGALIAGRVFVRCMATHRTNSDNLNSSYQNYDNLSCSVPVGFSRKDSNLLRFFHYGEISLAYIWHVWHVTHAYESFITCSQPLHDLLKHSHLWHDSRISEISLAYMWHVWHESFITCSQPLHDLLKLEEEAELEAAR